MTTQIYYTAKKFNFNYFTNKSKRNKNKTKNNNKTKIVGGLAATMNYLSSKNAFLSSLAALGLSLIYAANGGHGAPLLSMLPHDLAHNLHCGTVLHRSVNIIGCALLLSSNYFAHRLSCNHDHGGHGHGHDHSHDHSHSCCDGHDH